jgi:DNA topoisomerase-1
MKLILRKYQEDVVKFLEKNYGLLALHGTGSGKSVTSIASAINLIKKKMVTNAVIITKKSILSQFENEIKKVDETMLSKFVITTFQSMDKTMDLSKSFLIVDEAHQFSNPQGEMTKELFSLSKKCKRILFLTATIYKNSIEDLIPIFSILKKQDKFYEKDEFISIYENKEERKTFFANTISFYLIDKNQNENYPKVTYNEVSIKMNEETKKMFDKIAAKENKKPFYMEERQLSLGLSSTVNTNSVIESCTDVEKCYKEWDPVKENELLSQLCEKCSWLLKNIKKWQQQKEDKIVIYTFFKSTGLEVLKRLMINEGINSLLIDGETSAEKRKQITEVFNQQSHEMKGSAREKRPTVKKFYCGKDNTEYIRVTKGNPKEKNFDYYDKNLKKIAKTMKNAKIHKHSIPPGYSPAHVCIEGKGNVVWHALDAKNRMQRKYTDDWELIEREKIKIDLLKNMNKSFWLDFEEKINNDINKTGITKNTLCALAIKVMSICYFRVGTQMSLASEDEDEKHYGTTTLKKKHFSFTKTDVKIEFVGKSGKVNKCIIKRNNQNDAFFDKLELLYEKTNSDNFFEYDGIQINDIDVRKYLKENKIKLRPKDFRTFHANHMLLQFILKNGLAINMKQSQRKKVIQKAMKEIAVDLNNSPVVSKKSYVFEPLEIVYLTSPTQFDMIVKQSNSMDISDVLHSFISFFIKTDYQWKEMLKLHTKTYGLLNFTNKSVPVLIITDAGAESIDLKGVRHLVILDSIWQNALQDQIIGRSQRFFSHHHLSEDKRNVNIWKLILDYPEKATKSPERIIQNILDDKKTEMNELYKFLTEISI